MVPFIMHRVDIYVVPPTIAGFPPPEHLHIRIIIFPATMAGKALSSFVVRMNILQVHPCFSSVFPLSKYLFRKYFIAFGSTELLLGAAEYLGQASSNTGPVFGCHSELVVCD
jgi:hypothetical protein